ncbi:MAG: hypothetical protein U0169_13390 [Polyangiaceae bacterium]
MARPDVSRSTFSAFACLASLAACSATGGDASSSSRADPVVVDTSTDVARAQHAANVAFGSNYRAVCTKPSLDGGSPKKRVLVTGFNRFSDHVNNATGQMVARLVPGMAYPVNTSAPDGAVDDPARHVRTDRATVRLPKSGDVEICAMVLPVFWDLASALVAKELDAFEPDFVLMNGVARTRQPIWIEMGAVNRAQLSDDGSDRLRPRATDAGDDPKLVDGPDAPEFTRLLLSWDAVRDAARDAIAERKDRLEDGVRLDAILEGASFAGYPRTSNAYLCNNTTFVVDWLMGNPGATLPLMQASHPGDAGPSNLPVIVRADLRAVPRVFVHWPSDLAGAHLDSGADVLRAMVDAQLDALAHGDMPTLGDNVRADFR